MGNSSVKQNAHVYDSQGDDQHKFNSESKNDEQLRSKIESARTEMQNVVHRLKQTPGLESFLNAVCSQFSMFTGKSAVFESLEQQIANVCLIFIVVDLLCFFVFFFFCMYMYLFVNTV